jgi:hypothetical protein
MMTMLKKHVALAAMLAAVATLGAGCSPAKAPQPTGTARVGVDVSNLVVGGLQRFSDISRITLTVSGTGITPAIVVDLSKSASGLQWTAVVGGIPAGTGRTFAAQAFSGTGALLYEGSTTADVTANGGAVVVILLQESAPPPGLTNNAPRITSITASDGVTTPSGTVSLAVTATDPDPADTLTYAWASTCTGTALTGSFSSATVSNPVFTAPAFSPADCTLSLTVSDNRGASVNTFFAILVRAANNNATVNAFPNTFPVVSSLGAAFKYDLAANAMTVDFNLVATDPDGDNLAYAWTSTCPVTATNFFTQAPTAACPACSVTRPRWTSTVGDCSFTVTVTDLCTGGNCGLTGTGARADGQPRGGSTTGRINGFAPPTARRAPTVVRTIQPNSAGANGAVVIDPGQVYSFSATFTDPESGVLALAWTSSNGGFVAGSQVDTAPQTPGQPVTTVILWTAPTPMVAGATVSVTATSAASSLAKTFTFVTAPSDPCVGQADGTLCSDANACTTGDRCVAGVCTPVSTTTCAAQDACHVAGVCDPATGACTNPAAANGTACTDGNACTQNDACQAGVCQPGAPLTCVAQGQCFDAGTCNPATGACTNPPKAAGAACSDGNACTQTDACDGAGACAGTNPVVCTAGQCTSGGTCNPATGACQGGVNQPNGTPCSDANACTSGDACQGGLCTGTPLCGPTQTCTQTGGTCVVTNIVPTPQVAKLVSTSSLGLTMDTAGASYVTGALFASKTFDAVTVTSAGSADALVAKYDPTTRAAVWARAFGGGTAEATGPTDQLPAGVAVTADGTVVVIGSSNGNIVVNATTTVAIPALQDFVLGLNGTSGAGVWGSTFNNGLNGALVAVAANPTRNVFAVCGYADQASTLAPAGTVFGGGTRDAVIAMFSSNGTLVWSKQLGSGSDEECDTLAIDDAGDLYAAGKYNSVTGQTNLDPGLGALPSTTLGTRRHLWIAKYAGATGAALAQASFGSGNGNHTPFSMAVDAAGKVILGGSFTFSVPFGATTITSAGSTDGFVAKLDPAATPAFAPTWAVRIGGTTGDQVNGVAVTSFGEVLATGLFIGTTTGAATLTGAGTVASDAFLLKLDAATGATQFSAAYGDTSNQAGNAVVANRSGTGSVRDLVQFGGTYAGAVTFPAPAGALPASTGDSFLVFAPLQ